MALNVGGASKGLVRSKQPRFAKLAELFPATFAILPSDRRPLAIGIHDELLKIETGLSANKLRHALSSYCTSVSYLLQLVEGAPRIGLDGQPVGVVTASESEDAARRLADHMAKLAASDKAAKASPPNPVGQPKPMGEPKLAQAPIKPAPVKNAPAAPAAPQIAKPRLGLADLKAAAARRRQAAETS